MKKQFNSQERDAFAKAVSAVEGITFSKDDDAFFEYLMSVDEAPEAKLKKVVSRALEQV